MINQEDLYIHLISENWGEILSVLYKEKENIKNDTLLMSASETFVNEFLKKAGNYKLDNQEILNYLEDLNVLHRGNFYQLSEENHKKLTIEIIRRKDLKDAYNYAKYYPQDNYCKTIIKQYNMLNKEIENKNKKTVINNKMIPIELFNRLFELVNDQSDTATYFSGPRFIDTVRQFSPYFPDYRQYVDKRNEEGKSTTRKIFYYDILQELDENIRDEVIKRILEITKPFAKEKVSQIELIINGKNKEEVRPIVTEEIRPVVLVNEEITTRPIVFISYSWDDEEHKDWVLKLAK